MDNRGISEKSAYHLIGNRIGIFFMSRGIIIPTDFFSFLFFPLDLHVSPLDIIN